MIALLSRINLQGWIGLGSTVILAALLGLSAFKADHWHATALTNENLYRAEQVAHRQTIINYQNAAQKAQAADLANADRVKAEQAAINERTKTDYEARLANARAEYARLVRSYAAASGHSGGPAAAGVSGSGGSAGGPDGATAEDGLPLSDRLLATEQAIQLDELIKWVGKNLGVNYSGSRK